MKQRVLAIAAATLVSMWALAGSANAEGAFPARPIRMLIPYPSGGAIDTIGRTLADEMGRALGQPVIADNRPGAGGRMATDALAHAPADGYTLLVTTGAPITVAPALTNKLPYSVGKDLTPLTRVGDIINVMLVNPEIGVDSVKEFIAWAKKRGGPVRYGSAGVGSADHLAGELFQNLTGVEMQHVPYKGGGPALLDLASGRIEVGFSTYTVAQGLLNGGKLKVIAVTSPQRQPSMPKLEAVAETVPGFAITNWAGVFLPSGVPGPLAERLFREFQRAAGTAAVKAKLRTVGVEAGASASMDEFRSFVQEDTSRWKQIVKSANVPME